MEPQRNIKGGKGYKKRKTNRDRCQPKREFAINVEEGEGYYATVNKIVGGNQVEVTLNNGTVTNVIIPGRMKRGRKQGWIRQNMTVLVNTENEILKIVRDNDKDAVTAHNMMNRVASSRSALNFYESDSTSDDENEDTQNTQQSKTQSTVLQTQPEHILENDESESEPDDVFEENNEEEEEESETEEISQKFKSNKNNKAEYAKKRDKKNADLDIDNI